MQTDDEAGALAGRLHPDLRAIARRRLTRERHSDLQPTSLVNEAYLRLIQQRALPGISDPQFLALASICMQRVLIDTARRRAAIKRPQVVTDLAPVDAGARSGVEHRVLVREALTRLAAVNTRRASIVRLRFLDDLLVPEIAERTGLSMATVKRELKGGLAQLRALLASPPSRH